PLMLAQHYRPPLRVLSLAGCRRASLRRFLPHLLPAIPSSLSRHAAPLSHLSAGISGTQRSFHRGRIDSCVGLFASDGLSHLVHALWQGCRAESLAGHGAGVENGFAAAHGEFPCHAGSYLGTLRFSEPPRSWLDGRSAAARAGSWRRLVDL